MKISTALIETNLPSPIEPIWVDGHRLYLKRDDLIGPILNGNKARKFYTLLANSSAFKAIVSSGSLQSNAMMALSYLAHSFNIPFYYHSHSLLNSSQIPNEGNLKASLLWGMELVDFSQYRALLAKEGMLVVPQGGAFELAREGIESLAKEIEQFASEKGGRWILYLPSGTGTTALYLSSYFVRNELPIEVVTVACVGSDSYLREQFEQLQSNCALHPRILPHSASRKFGKLSRSSYAIYHELLEQTGIEFDLLYDPIGWRALREFDYLDGANIIYLHQGGLSGNETMLKRYENMGL